MITTCRTELVPVIADLFECAHVRDFGLARESRDETIHAFAKQQGYTIVTSDRDFLRLAELYGVPPQVIWLETMDYPTRAAAIVLRRYAVVIEEFGRTARAILTLKKNG